MKPLLTELADALQSAVRELNEIRARDGVPYTQYGWKASVSEEYFSKVVDDCHAVLTRYASLQESSESGLTHRMLTKSRDWPVDTEDKSRLKKAADRLDILAHERDELREENERLRAIERAADEAESRLVRSLYDGDAPPIRETAPEVCELLRVALRPATQPQENK